MTPKFRIYDKVNKRYVLDPMVIFLQNKGFLWGKGKGDTWKDETKADLEMFSTHCDKNKKEIYEGDRIHIFVDGNKYPLLATVEFIKGNFCLVGGKNYIHGSLSGNPWDLEVVGNIHEEATNGNV